MVIQTIVTLSTIIFGEEPFISAVIPFLGLNVSLSGFGIPCRGPIMWLAILTMLQVLKCRGLADKCQHGQVSVGQVSVGQVSARTSVSPDKCQHGQVSVLTLVRADTCPETY